MLEHQSEKGKYIFGTVKIGEKGQIVIPKDARDVFDLKPGDSLMVFGDIRQGIALCKTEWLQPFAEELFRRKEQENGKNE